MSQSLLGSAVQFPLPAPVVPHTHDGSNSAARTSITYLPDDFEGSVLRVLAHLYRFNSERCSYYVWYGGMAQVLSREERGRMIAEKPNQIVRLEERFYKVASQSSDKMYAITKRMNGGWLCTCPDFEYRNVICKHIWAVQISLTVRKEVEARVIEPISFEACIYCRSENIIDYKAITTITAWSE